MCKKDYTVEDFVLDPEFQKWVLYPDTPTKIYWEAYVAENPGKHKDMVQARKLVLNMSRKERKVDQEFVEATWNNIEQALNKIQVGERNKKVIPLDSSGTLRKFEKETGRDYNRSTQFYRLVGILVLTFSLSLIVNLFLPQPATRLAELPVVYEEHIAPPGVKSNLTLHDGSKVILNSGSSLRYIKNFEPHQRVLELQGEAYFEVAEDKSRPFKVKTGPVTTTALGTSFNIKAFENEPLDISLFTGLVAVDFDLMSSQNTRLDKGQGMQINLAREEVKKVTFDAQKVLAWTKKTIVFDHTSMNEIKRVLENWYGVKIRFANVPRNDLELSGKFQDQTLENVLEGLSYSARFNFRIDKDQVILNFN
ncbi:FecR family protein [Cyclobacterium lianum]|nr:FecR family protein [Cyclobacterium lianum]